MSVDLSEFEFGAEWAYRVRDSAPSERVRIVGVVPKKTRSSSRAEVAFLDDDGRVLRTELIPIGRLRVPWGEARTYDALMANWARIDDTVLTDAEDSAVWSVFEHLIPKEIAEVEWSPVRDHLRIHLPERLSEVGTDLETVTSQVESFEDGDEIVASPAGTLVLAEAACAINPAPILEWVMSEELEYREKCKRGGSFRNLEGQEEPTSPEFEYDLYLRYHRPVHEIVRQWCGYRAVSFQERLAAAEAENRRLDILLARAIDALKRDKTERLAEVLESEHERERVTPERARPVVDRPLSPHEMPVRYVRQPRRWGY